MESVLKEIAEITGSENVSLNEPMKKHTTFVIGGEADIFITPESTDALKRVLGLLESKNIPVFVMGNGSNILVGDKGIRGAVVCLSKLCGIEVCGTSIKAEAGIMLSKLAGTATENSLSGLEFASGIPGTLGGAIYMNAGAYGGEMKDVISKVCYLENGEVKEISGAECDFSYRYSIFAGSDKVILGCTVELKNGDKTKIKAEIDELNKRRFEKQPLNKPSAGSTFKRPEGYFAGKLIQDANLQGFSIGGAEVSTKHAGFVINKGGATAKDVLDLINHIKKEVFENFGVELEAEVKLVGEF